MLVVKAGNHFKFNREMVSEYFRIFVSTLVVRNLREGARLPSFYLPIWKTQDRYCYECWILPLAFPVLVLRIVGQVFRITWSDLVDWLCMLYEWNKPKK